MECNAIESPEYKLVNKLTDDVEIRTYAPSKWACTTTSVGATSMFYQLFNYISGQNEQHVKIEMTAPVLNSYDNSNNLIEMCFFVPKSFHSNTPKPTGTVFITEKSETTVAVLTFGGRATLKDHIEHKSKLIQVLNEKSIQYKSSNLITAGFDKPSKPDAERTNQVFVQL